MCITLKQNLKMLKNEIYMIVDFLKEVFVMRKIALLGMVLMLFGCEKNVLYQGDDGKTFTFQVGEQFTIKLPENPSTGYQWNLQTDPKSQMVVSVLSDQFTHSKSELIGAGGDRIFQYQATNSGTVRIYGFHRRSWERQEIRPAFKFTIVVR